MVCSVRFIKARKKVFSYSGVFVVEKPDKSRYSFLGNKLLLNKLWKAQRATENWIDEMI